MTRLFAEGGRHVPVTVLALENLQVTGVRTKDRDGYTAVQLGIGKAKAKNVRQAEPRETVRQGQGLEAPRKLVEFRVATDAVLEDPAPSLVAERVSCTRARTSTSSGATVGQRLRRLRWWALELQAGLEASRTASRSRHRSATARPASRQDPGRTFPGKKMAGHLRPLSA